MGSLLDSRKQATPTLIGKVERLCEVKRQLAKLKPEDEELSNEIKEYLGECTELVFNNKVLATYNPNSKPNTYVNQELLKEKYPEIYKEVTYQQVNRRLLLK
jgi:predicted phage-related endonuclease